MNVVNLLYVIFKVCWTLFFWPVVILTAISAIGGVITFFIWGVFKLFSYVAHKLTNNHIEGVEGKYQREPTYKKSTVASNDTTFNQTDPYAILGVIKGASIPELKKAYKIKIMNNHPDKLSTLDPELRQIATERTIKIKEAYQLLMG